MIQMEVKCWFIGDTLRGTESTEIRVKFVKILEDSLPAGEDQRLEVEIKLKLRIRSFLISDEAMKEGCG